MKTQGHSWHKSFPESFAWTGLSLRNWAGLPLCIRNFTQAFFRITSVLKSHFFLTRVDKNFRKQINKEINLVDLLPTVVALSSLIKTHSSFIGSTDIFFKQFCLLYSSKGTKHNIDRETEAGGRYETLPKQVKLWTAEIRAVIIALRNPIIDQL